jgi:hypothetical protein
MSNRLPISSSTWRQSEGRWLANLPAPYADVGIELSWWPSVARFSITYSGPAESLIAAGAATDEQLLQGRGNKAGVRDANGDRATLDYRDGSPHLHLRKTAERALRLPGITAEVLAVAQAPAQITMLPMKGIPDAELALDLVMDALKRRDSRPGPVPHVETE